MSMRFPVVCVAFFAAAPLFAAPIGLVDMDEEDIEIRIAAVIRAQQQEQKQVVQLAICKDPLTKFDEACADRKIVTPTIDADRFTENVRSFLGLANQPEQALQTERERSVVWARKLLREKFEMAPLLAKSKESSEELLDRLVTRLDPEIDEKQQATAQYELDDLQEKLARSGTDFADVFFEEVEGRKFTAALSPFAAWMEKNLCHCELDLSHGEATTLTVPQCVLRKGDEILAYSPATLEDCTSRKVCRSRNWYADSRNLEKQDFELLLKARCDEYFLQGSVVRGVRSVVRKKTKNSE
jgi:hypothetical protein